MRQVIFSVVFYLTFITAGIGQTFDSVHYKVTDSTIEAKAVPRLDTTSLILGDSASMNVVAHGDQGIFVGNSTDFSIHQLQGKLCASISFDSLPGQGLYSFNLSCAYFKKEKQKIRFSSNEDTLIKLSSGQVSSKNFSYSLDDVIPYFPVSGEYGQLVLIADKLEPDTIGYTFFRRDSVTHKGIIVGGTYNTLPIYVHVDTLKKENHGLKMRLSRKKERKIIDF